MTQIVYFVGVATGGSSIVSLFPRWMERLGIDARVEGVDLPLGAARAAYRDVVQRIADDPRVAGAVITAHKLGVYAAAHDLFDVVDRLVPLCQEVSAISKRDHRLEAHARDPIASHAVLRTMLGPDYWIRHPADVLCLGAGGAATAIALCLLTDPESLTTGLQSASAPPRRIIFVDIDRNRLDALRRMIETVNTDARVEYVCHPSAHDNDTLLASLPPASLVINATGMGKDRPGSPLTDAAEFPPGAVVWDLNYRGSLLFLQQARTQQESRQLQLHDGWLYFLHGWTQALSPVLHVDLTGAVFEDLAALAAGIAPANTATRVRNPASSRSVYSRHGEQLENELVAETNTSSVVRPARVSDAAAIARIYNQGIAERIATFEVEPRTARDIVSALEERGTRYPTVVVERAGEVIAVAWVSPYRARACYEGIGEFSVYTERDARGSGAGRAVMEGLIAECERRGFWKLVARIFPENTASRGLCRRLGFREVGVYRRHGKLGGEWRDCVIVERLLGEAAVGLE